MASIVKTVLLTIFLALTAQSCFAYFSQIELPKEEAERLKFDVKVRVEEGEDRLRITVEAPYKDKDHILQNFSIRRIENGKITFLVSDLQALPISKQTVGITFEASREELAKMVIGIEYRTSQLVWNGWEYLLPLDSYYKPESGSEAGGTRKPPR